MTALLEVRALRVWYGAARALDGISFDVDEGEVVAVIGSNGDKSIPGNGRKGYHF